MPLFFNIFCFKGKGCFFFLGPVSVQELVSVEDAPSARFARYGI